MAINANQAVVCVGLQHCECGWIDLLNFSQFDFNKDQGVEGTPGVRDKSDLAVQMYGLANCADGAVWRHTMPPTGGGCLQCQSRGLGFCFEAIDVIEIKIRFVGHGVAIV